MARNNIAGILDKIAEVSLYVLIFALPFSKSIIEISIVTAFASLGLKKIITKDFKLKKTPLDLLLFAFFIASSISIVNADFKLLVLRSLVSKCLKYIILYFVIVETIDSAAKLKNLIKITIFSAIVVMVDCYIQYYVTHVDLVRFYPSFKFVLPPPNHFRLDYLGFPVPHPYFLGFPTGPFPFPNDLSAWMLVILIPVLCFFIWYAGTFRSRLLFSLFLAPLAFLFYLANTRSAWLSFLVSFLLVSFVGNKKKVIAIFLLIIMVLSPFLIKDKIGDIFGYTSMQDRYYMWRIGWKIFLEHPIIGNGFNTFFVKFKEFREEKEYKNKKGSYAHNAYLQIAADTGIIGLAAFLFLIGRVFISAFGYIRKKEDLFCRTFAMGLGAGLSAFLIHSFFDTNLQSLPLATLFWFSLSVLMSLCVNERTI